MFKVQSPKSKVKVQCSSFHFTYEMSSRALTRDPVGINVEKAP